MPIIRYLTYRSWGHKGAIIIAALLFSSLGHSALAQQASWPLKQKPDLSSGFGEFRQGRFHSGIDLRTGGRVGRGIYSPVDGYVWRVKMSYQGYGKGLYVKGDDGYVYVFAHLSKFVSKIEEAVKKAQFDSKRYYLDKYFPKDSIRVTKGERIAFSGQSGVGAPHLHFEKRSPENVPLNPLLHGFSLDDKIQPVFTSFGIELTGETSLLPDASRGMRIGFADINPNGEYNFPYTFYSDRDFGIVVGCYDQMRAGGMKQTNYHLSLSVDDKIIYSTKFDTIPFNQGAFVNLEYDVISAANGDARIRRLYTKRGNKFQGSRSTNSSHGIIGPTLSRGLHRGLITAEDSFGNKASLKFNFLWGGKGEIFATDSTVKINDTLRHYYFSATKGAGRLNIDSTLIELNQGENWFYTNIGKVVKATDSSLEVAVHGLRVRRKVLRLVHFTQSGPIIAATPFHGILSQGQKRVTVTHEILDDGMFVTCKSNALNGLDAHLFLYDGEKLLGTERPDRFYSISSYHFFVPAREEYRKVSRLAVALVTDTTNARRNGEKDLIIRVLGFASVDSVRVDDFFSITSKKEDFFSPRFVEFEKTEIGNKYRMGLNSDVYKIFPEVFATRSEFDVSIGLPPPKKYTHHDNSGLCWLDEEENRWIWLENSRISDNVLLASSIGGGTFAAVIDAQPPFIIGENIVDGRTYQTTMPKFKILVGDSLSGIEDDRSIVITIDREWQIPEYDPEREICYTQPIKPLTAGNHVLRIEVTDRAGNKFDEGWNFRISSSAKPAGGSK